MVSTYVNNALVFHKLDVRIVYINGIFYNIGNVKESLLYFRNNKNKIISLSTTINMILNQG